MTAIHISTTPANVADLSMTHFSTPAIILNRRSYADFDLIVTVISRDYGKCTLIAKSAKKSVKRFSGGLEPFTLLQIVYRKGRGKGMFILEESSIENAFSAIRTDIIKTAYANYWAELIYLWLEAGQEKADVFHLLSYALSELDGGNRDEALIDILFQLRFIGQEGFRPVLEHCLCCRNEIDKIPQKQFCFDLKQGGVVCRRCPAGSSSQTVYLSKGTLKQLQWLMGKDLSIAERVRFSSRGIEEATEFLRSFVPYHIGKKPKSLQFLKQVCSGG